MQQPSTSKRCRSDSDSTDEYNDFSDSESNEYIPSDIDSDSDNDKFIPSKFISTNIWSTTPKTTRNIPFTGKPGIKINMTRREPIDYFHLLFNDDFYELIIRETTDYAVQVLVHSAKTHSRINKWKDMTKEDFKVWLGLLFHMGTMRINHLADYWKTNELFGMKVFSKYMARDRFLIILKALHFDIDKNNSSNLHKLQPLIDLFNKTMSDIYIPDKNLSISESLLLWKGCLITGQDIKGNNSNRGIKLHMLTEVNGPALKFNVYNRENGIKMEGQEHINELVLKLLKDNTGFGYSVYMNSFYNNVSLTDLLYEQNTYVTGPLRSDRKDNPDEIRTVTVKYGESINLYKDNGICVMKSKGKRKVMFISSEFNGEKTNITNQKKKIVEKPKMIKEYNNKNNNDFKDHLMLYYSCDRIIIRWYKKLGIHIFQTILLNAYYLHLKDLNSKKIGLHEFRLSVIKSLLNSISISEDIPIIPTTAESSSEIGTIKQKNIIHLPMFCEKSLYSGITKRKRCKYCYHKKIRRDSIFCCLDCPKQPGLCLAPCFRLFHNYK